MDIELLYFFTDVAPKLENMAKNEVHRAIFEAFLVRSNATSIDLYSLRSHLISIAKTAPTKELRKIWLGLKTEDIRNFFNGLTRLGLGTLEPYGDRKIRFKSESVGLKELSLLALGRGNDISTMSLSKFKLPMKSVKSSVVVKSKKELRKYRFQLRPTLELELDLPEDLSKDETERLSFFIKSLAMS